MPRPFDITTPKDKVDLDGECKGQAAFTVSNSSGATARGRARVVPGDPVQNPWYTIDGDTERTLRADQTTQYTVRISLPKDTAKGDYTVRLDMVALDNPDEIAVEGPRVIVLCKGPVVVNGTTRFPWLIVLIAAAVVLAAGIAAWVFWPGGPKKLVPDVVAMNITFADAETKLKADGFSAKRGKTTVQEGKARDIVIDQSPKGGREAPVGSEVTLDVAAEIIMVPVIQKGTMFSGDIINQFTSLGLLPTVGSEVSREPENSILRTKPAGGSPAGRGDKVTIVLARPKTKTVRGFKADVEAQFTELKGIETRPRRQPP